MLEKKPIEATLSLWALVQAPGTTRTSRVFKHPHSPRLHLKDFVSYRRTPIRPSQSVSNPTKPVRPCEIAVLNECESQAAAVIIHLCLWYIHDCCVSYNTLLKKFPAENNRLYYHHVSSLCGLFFCLSLCPLFCVLIIVMLPGQNVTCWK